MQNACTNSSSKIVSDVTKSRFVPSHIMKEWEREAQEALATGKSYATSEEMMIDILGKNYDA